ncbi:MAG TPA: TatD family hydrolase [Patescibacteria group bacterium]|nr:TatD family hydrolase [Patescibacteria group bacterium]
MIDTHAHIDTEAFGEDRREVLKRAFDSGMEYIIIPSIGVDGFKNLQELVESEPRVFRGIGIHPHNVASVTDEDLERVERESFLKKVVAIGEIGLDYYYDFAPKDVQQDIFKKQLDIAKRRKLPVIIHNRDADDDVLKILDEAQDGALEGVLHCFSGTPEFLKSALDLNFHVSYTGNITYKKSTLSETVLKTPLERMMIETDSPYLTPVPHRGKRNEPSYVRFIAEKIAEIKGITLQEVISMTSETAKKLFRLSVIALCIFASFTAVQAQDGEEEYYDEEEVVNPYRKFIGFGVTIGTNTIVETQRLLPPASGEPDVSFDGLFAYGGTLSYSPLDFLMLESTYLYSINRKVVFNADSSAGFQSNPNTHQFIELVARFVLRPYSRVNFFATFGGAYILNTINGGDEFVREYERGEDNTRTAISTGLGIQGNIQTPFGLITPMAEWRINFQFGEDKNRVVNSVNGAPVSADVTTFYSIPRFSLLWYPSF